MIFVGFCWGLERFEGIKRKLMNLFGNVLYLVFDIWILWTRSNVY